MAGAGESTSSPRAPRAAPTGTTGAEAITPLYERLPRGPHQLDRGEVADNQRQRMYGAMIEAVATSGYGRTSVKQVVSLAGVSRRAFYEQFANKQECFLATLDLIAAQAIDDVATTYRMTEGTLEERLGAALTTLAETVCANPKGARLMLVDAPSAGPAGWERSNETLMAFEERLVKSFARAGAAPLREPVARAIVGGLRRATIVRLLEERTEEMPGLVADMLSWTLVFRTDEPSRFGDGSREAPTAACVSPEDDRARVLHSVLELAALEGYGNLTPMRIVDEAGVSIDTFFEQFDDVETCLLAALEKLGEEIRDTVDDPGLARTEEWPAAVRRAMDALMRYFAARPAYTQTIATGVFAMGRRAVDLGAELAREVATRLTAGAPGPPSTGLVQEGIEGAIWHTIYLQASRGGTDTLPQLSDYLAYVVLAPFLGAEQAARVVTEG